MTDLHNLFNETDFDRSEERYAVLATISSGDASGNLKVLIPSFDGGVHEFPVFTSDMQVGSSVAVIEDDAGQYWAIGGTGGSNGSTSPPMLGGQDPMVMSGVTDVSTEFAAIGRATVSHSFGVKPSQVFLTPISDGLVIANLIPDSLNEKEFTIGIRYIDGVSRSMTTPIQWLVIE